MKGIILAAGEGTRFSPITRAVPKEMLPIGNRPAISFLVEEFLQSGIKEIFVVTGDHKQAIEDYLSSFPLTDDLWSQAHFAFIRQRQRRGTGDALLQVVPFLGKESVVVGYPDDVHFGPPLLTQQLIEEHQKTGCCVLATIEGPPNIQQYGVIKPEGKFVTGFVEKPPVDQLPSRLASIGRYLYTEPFFTFLAEGWARHREGEFYHSYALNEMIKRRGVVHCPAQGTHFDIGQPAGLLAAWQHYVGETL